MMSNTPVETPTQETPQPPAQPQDSYVKLAMRNMVRKKGTSLKHFFLTTVGLLALLVGLSYLTR
jgi:Protein of unknown function (DUF3285)